MSQTKAQLVVGLSPNASAPDDALTIDSSGRVGIGTDAPSVTVEAQGAQAELQLKSTSGTNSAGLRFVPGGETNALYIYADGSRNINFDNHATSLISVRSGGGITFNGDTAATNALGDYEEGTWEPGYSFGGTAHTSIVSAGTYIKIGGMVFVTGYLYTNNSNTYSGTATITGLPFSIPSGMRYRGAFTIGQIRRFNEDMPNIKLYAGDNGSVISMLRQSTNSNGATELTNSQFNFQSEYNILSFSGSYPVA